MEKGWWASRVIWLSLAALVLPIEPHVRAWVHQHFHWFLRFYAAGHLILRFDTQHKLVVRKSTQGDPNADRNRDPRGPTGTP